MSELQLFFNKFVEIVKNSSVASDYSKAIEFILEYFKVKSELEQISNFQLLNGQKEESQISLAIYSKVEEFLNMFCNFMGNMKMPADEFLQVFLTGFNALKLNLSPVSIDCVIVQNNTDGFFIQYRFICIAKSSISVYYHIETE